jgi:hypothetical protein
MSYSTSKLDLISSSQSGKEISANTLFDAASPATMFGRRITSTGLSWQYYGGSIMLNGTQSDIANGSVNLIANSYNYVEYNRAAMTVYSNTTGFSAGYVPLYKVYCNATTQQSWEDWRCMFTEVDAVVSVPMSDADYTLTAPQSYCSVFEVIGSLTATRDIIIPTGAKKYHVVNNASNSVRIKTSGGAGVTIATGKAAVVYYSPNSGNVIRLTPDV